MVACHLAAQVCVEGKEALMKDVINELRNRNQDFYGLSSSDNLGSLNDS